MVTEFFRRIFKSRQSDIRKTSVWFDIYFIYPFINFTNHINTDYQYSTILNLILINKF